MKLDTLELHNFRSFYGTQTIEFSEYDELNVTLVHAQNGVGKTNLLNAVLWNFYGITTGKFEKKEMLMNDEARSKGHNECSVKVTFNHENQKYISLRSVDKNSKNTIFKIWKAEGSNIKEDRHPEQLINGIIPKEMATHFFFDGEHAETFASEKNNKKIESAVKQILGCHIADVALKDLKEIKKKILQKITDEIKDENIKQLSQEINGIRNFLDTFPDTEKDFKSKIDEKNGSKREIISQLVKHENSERLQRSLNTFKKSLQNSYQKLADINNKFFTWTGKKALPLVSKKIINDFNEILKHEKTEINVSSQYKQSFIKELLETEMCICGRSIGEHTDAHIKIKSLLAEAFDMNVLDNFEKVKLTCQKIKSQSVNINDDLSDLIREKDLILNEIANYETEIKILSEQFKGINDEEIKALKQKENVLDNEINTLNQQFSQLKLNSEKQKQRLVQLTNDYNAKSANINVNRNLNEQIKIIDALYEKLENELNENVDQARRIIAKRVNDYLQTAGTGTLSIIIDQNFNLKAFQNNRPMPSSGGQNQLISLVFTAALVWFSKMRLNADHPILIKGTLAPLFLDAPFGQLDKIFQKKVCEILPTLSNQLIILFSDSQGNKDVRDQLEPKVGKQYIIESHVKTDQKSGLSDQEITLNGKSYKRAFYNSKIEKSQILEVE